MGIDSVNINDVVSAATANQSGGSQGSAPTTEASQSGSPSTQNTASPAEQAQAILNLDQAQKFKFGDREWTPDQLKKSMMLHSDYTKKTQAISEARKYYDNLEHDLDYIRNHHNKQEAAQAFTQTYPKEFHKYLKHAGIDMAQEASSRQMQAQSNTEIPPEILRDLQMVKTYVQEKETQAIEAQLDQTFSSLSKKYPDGDEDVVLARAQALLDSKRESDPGFRITNEVWEKLWKASHDKYAQKREAHQKGIIEKQRTANSSYRAPAPGGATPGQAPVRRTMKEATEFAVQTLSGRKG